VNAQYTDLIGLFVARSEMAEGVSLSTPLKLLEKTGLPED
jgi:hypothetical protein